MRYTLEREQNRNAAISVGVRPAAHNSRTCTASKAPYRACRNLANIHSCSCGGISSMVESCTVTSPRYLDVVLQLSKYQRGRHCANLMHLGLVYAGYWVFGGLHEKLPGFTTIVVLMLFLHGVQFLLVGIVGEYVGQIFTEVKQRPVFVVDHTINLPPRPYSSPDW